MHSWFLYKYYDAAQTQICITDSRITNNKTWRIPDIIDGKPVTAISSGAFCNRDDVETVYIPDSVSYIGCDAFKNCKKLQEVIFYKTSNPAKSLEICAWTFYGCTKLTVVNCFAPIYVRSFAFMECVALQNFNAKILAAEKKSFGKCAKLRTATFGKNAAWEENSFIGCKSLSQLFFYDVIAEHISRYEGKMKLLKGKVISCTPNFNQIDLAYTGYNIDVSLS